MTPVKEIIRLGQVEVRFLLESEDSKGQLAMFECTIPEGARVPVPHYHENYDETVYGLEGVITFTVEGKPNHVGPGESLFIPRGAVHGFTNSNKGNARILCVVTPALIGPDFFKESAAVINAGGPPDIEKMKAVLLKHGLVPVTGNVLK